MKSTIASTKVLFVLGVMIVATSQASSTILSPTYSGHYAFGSSKYSENLPVSPLHFPSSPSDRWTVGWYNETFPLPGHGPETWLYNTNGYTVFNLSSIEAPVSSATLRFNGTKKEAVTGVFREYAGEDESRIDLFRAESSVFDLVHGDGPNRTSRRSIDYGSTLITYDAFENERIEIELNEAALIALNEAMGLGDVQRGGWRPFAVSAASPFPNSIGDFFSTVFYGEIQGTDIELVLDFETERDVYGGDSANGVGAEVVPEPSTLLVFAGLLCTLLTFSCLRRFAFNQGSAA